MCADGTCRDCRREERELNKAMGTERTYSRSRGLNREERDLIPPINKNFYAGIRKQQRPREHKDKP